MNARLRAPLLLVVVAVWAMRTATSAAGYSEAEFTRLHNDVKVLKESAASKEAAVGQKIKPVTSVATGADSRAEMRFPDKSLTRLGANSRFTLRGESRTLDLDQGVLLLQVPEQIRGAKVRTAAVTAAVTGGTVMFEYLPGGFVKLIVIEGYVDLFFNNNPGNYRTYGPGEMVIGKFDEGGNVNASLPDSVEVDLEALLKSSKLLSNDDTSAINQDLVNQAIDKQQGEIKEGKLVETNLVIPGRGTLVQITTDTRIGALTFRDNPAAAPPAAAPGVTPGTTPTTQGAQNTTPPPPFQGIAPLIAGKTVLNENSTIVTDPYVNAYNVGKGSIIKSDGVVYNGATNGLLLQYYTFGNSSVVSLDLQAKINAEGAWALFRFEDLFINGSPTWNPDIEEYYPNAILASNNGIRLGGINQYTEGVTKEQVGGYDDPPAGGGEGPDTVLDLDYSGINSLMLVSDNGDIIIRGSPDGKGIYGYNQDLTLVTYGLGSDVRIEGNIYLGTGGSSDPSTLTVVSGRDTVVQAASVSADQMNIQAGRDVKITGGTIEARTGNVDIKATGQINITDSSVLKALASGGKILITSANGDVKIGRDDTPEDTSENITLSATDTIEIQALNTITLNRVTSSSDVFKATTMSPSGWITIGNSNITANTMIELFGGSAGGVRFVENSTLDSPNVTIGGHTVEILPDKHVQIPKGALNIGTTARPTTNHNYNRTDGEMGKSFGTFHVGGSPPPTD